MIKIFIFISAFILSNPTRPIINTINYNVSTLSYTVSWSHSTFNEPNFSLSHYELYEVNTGLSYDVTGTSKAFSNRPSGTYRYKVRSVFTAWQDPDALLRNSNSKKKKGGITVQRASTTAYSHWSSEKNVTVYQPIPVPTLLTANAISGRQIELTWEPVSNISSYKLYSSSTANGTYSLVSTYSPSTNSATIAGLEQGRTYYFKLKAASGQISSNYSNTLFTVTPRQASLKWVHGWRSDANSFAAETRTFVREGLDGLALEANEDVAEYESIEGFAVARNSLFQDITSVNDAIFIGHSFGGLASRSLVAEQNWGERIQGIITIGTPNQGAVVMNNRHKIPGMLTNFIADMAHGPDATFRFLLGVKIIPLNLFGSIINIVSEVLYKASSSGYEDQTMLEFAKNTPQIAQVDAATENFTKASVILEETNDNELIRLVSGESDPKKAVFDSEAKGIQYWDNIASIYMQIAISFQRLAMNYDFMANEALGEFNTAETDGGEMDEYYLYRRLSDDMTNLANAWWSGAAAVQYLPSYYKRNLLEGFGTGVDGEAVGVDGVLNTETQRYGSALFQFKAKNSSHIQQNSPESQFALRRAARKILGLD